MPKFKDLAGQKFGKLTLLKRDGFKKRTYWICKCECGSIKSIRQDAIQNGRSISCGCYHKNIASRKSTNKKYNKHEIRNGTCTIFDSSGNEILLDEADYEIVKKYCWSKNLLGYAAARESDYDHPVLMHRIILGAKKGEFVDHKNHNKLDNRRKNIRICTQSQNGANQRISLRNTSGVKGVYWDKRRKIWHAKIGHNNKSLDLGRYRFKKDAIEARIAAEEKYFKEFQYKEAEDFEFSKH